MSLVEIGNQETPATDKDILTGFELYHAIVYCPEMDMKLYRFVDQLLSSEIERTIIQSYANLFHSGVLKGTTSIPLAKEFYMDLAANLNLQYGNILLATSTKSQLQALRNIDVPFFTNNTDLVKTCIWDSKCDQLQHIIGDLGKTFSLSYPTFLTVADVNNVSKELSLHPVNLTPDTNGNLPPSALVPFCFYQKDHNLPGPTTFCDKFEPTTLEGQLCYSLDVTKFERKTTKLGKKDGLFLLLDPNPYLIDSSNVEAARNDQESFKLYIHTLAPHTAYGPGAYAMHTLKKMTGKSSFYQMQDSQKECQVHSREKCQTERFMKHVRGNCSCVPWALLTTRINKEVISKFISSNNFPEKRPSSAYQSTKAVFQTKL